MTSNSKVFFSICISILVHIFFVMNFLNDENKDQEIYVLNLSTYQQVQFEKQKSIPKEIEKTPDVEKPRKEEKKVETKHFIVTTTDQATGEEKERRVYEADEEIIKYAQVPRTITRSV